MSQKEATAIITDAPGRFRTTAIAPLVARYGLVIVLAWFGAMNCTSMNPMAFHIGWPIAPS